MPPLKFGVIENAIYSSNLLVSGAGPIPHRCGPPHRRDSVFVADQPILTAVIAPAFHELDPPTPV
jgi:hypothetical protein